MDDRGQLEYATASGNDYPQHEQMYRTFVTLTKTFVAVIAIIVILMAIFLTGWPSSLGLTVYLLTKPLGKLNSVKLRSRLTAARV
jgi:hypothetical protein